MLAVQPVVPGLVPCAATPGRQPAAVLFTGSAREYWLRLDRGVRRRRHKLFHCPVCGKRRRARAEAIYCSAGCRVKAWRKRQRDAAEAQALTETER